MFILFIWGGTSRGEAERGERENLSMETDRGLDLMNHEIMT